MTATDTNTDTDLIARAKRLLVRLPEPQHEALAWLITSYELGACERVELDEAVATLGGPQ